MTTMQLLNSGIFNIDTMLFIKTIAHIPALQLFQNVFYSNIASGPICTVSCHVSLDSYHLGGTLSLCLLCHFWIQASYF